MKTIIILLLLVFVCCSGCTGVVNTSLDIIGKPFGYECKDDSNYSGKCHMEKVVP